MVDLDTNLTAFLATFPKIVFFDNLSTIVSIAVVLFLSMTVSISQYPISFFKSAIFGLLSIETLLLT